jgi:hypothetical protein
MSSINPSVLNKGIPSALRVYAHDTIVTGSGVRELYQTVKSWMENEDETVKRYGIQKIVWGDDNRFCRVLCKNKKAAMSCAKAMRKQLHHSFPLRKVKGNDKAYYITGSGTYLHRHLIQALPASFLSEEEAKKVSEIKGFLPNSSSSPSSSPQKSQKRSYNKETKSEARYWTILSTSREKAIKLCLSLVDKIRNDEKLFHDVLTDKEFKFPDYPEKTEKKALMLVDDEPIDTASLEKAEKEEENVLKDFEFSQEAENFDDSISEEEIKNKKQKTEN